MSKKASTNYTYGRGERRAEREMDAYLRRVNGTVSTSVLEELRALNDN